MKKNFFVLIFSVISVCTFGKTFSKVQITQLMYSSKFSSNVFYKNLNIQSDFQLSLKTKKFLSTIPLEQKIAQLLLVNIEGKNNFVPIRDFKEGGKNGILPGGYLLFSFNLSPTPESLNSFLTQVEQAHLRCSSFLPLFSVDCEGGKVNRLGIYQEQKLPSQEYISSHLNSSEAQKLYSESSELMNKCGLDLNFAPVVEVKNKFNEKFLSERSYGSFENTVKYSVIQISEAKKNNCLNVIKHFPGNSQDDPHAMVSVLDVSKTFFEQELLAPFNEVIKIKPHGVLISHVIIPSIDNEPACFSKKIVTEYLKEKLKFTGIVYSDDIYMKALTQDSSLENVALAASKAFKAGVNVIMSSEKKYLSLVYKIADYCTQDFDLLQNIEESVFKLTKEKYKLSKVFFN